MFHALAGVQTVAACKRAGDGLCGVIVGLRGLFHCGVGEQAL
jgi:hypothetical protein